MPEKVAVHYHDRCFDGASSAAVFTRFYSQCINSDAEFIYHGLIHQPAGLFDNVPFEGDVNAIVDFKYSPSPKLTWWFDHHHSAFLSPEDAQQFETEASPTKFFDPTYQSCTGYIARIAKDKFGFDPSPLSALIQWADVIDGAAYESPEVAVKMDVPATRIALVIEASPDESLTRKLIPDLARLSLDEIAELPYIRDNFEMLYERHKNTMEIMKKQCEFDRGVLYYDLTEYELEGYNKFIPYYLHPEAVFSVGVSRTPRRVKIGVGSNPWQKVPEDVNLAAICERHGGGGHPRVAAISFEPGQSADAKRIGREIVEQIRNGVIS